MNRPPRRSIALRFSLDANLQSATYKKSARPCQLPEQLPSLQMSSIIGRVATGRRKVNRYAAIVRDRQDIEQLLQIRTMIFVVAPRNPQSGQAVTQSRDHDASS